MESIRAQRHKLDGDSSLKSEMSFSSESMKSALEEHMKDTVEK
jgi:hypothetical protein